MSELIYITEDEEDILELLSMMLTSAGYRTRGFTTAKQMLESMEQELPELILLDLMLPDLDGLEACRRIRSNPAWELVPIVMLTARSDISDRVKTTTSANLLTAASCLPESKRCCAAAAGKARATS